MLECEYFIHQMKEIIFFYLLMYLILKMDMKVENGIGKSIFFAFKF